MKRNKVLQIADKPTLDKILDYTRRIDAGIFNAQSLDWGAYFSSRATGEVFSTKFYKQSVSDTVIGERLNDSVGKTCEPSTDTVKGRDDFAPYNAFWFTDCNFIVNDAGVKIPTYIDGQGGFSRTGKVDVGVLTPPLYYGIQQVSDGEIWHLSDSPHPELGLVLMPHCKDAKGNPLPYGIITKYYAGTIDGVFYSSSGLPVSNFTSYQSLRTAMQKKGAGYTGSGSERSIFLITMLRIKYATSSSQKIFAGYTNYSYQYKVSQASTGNYVVLTKAQAANFLIGSVVSIGDPVANTNIDRGNAYMRNLADKVMITKVEAVDATYSRVYVDAPSMIVTATSYISTMPLYSGQTDSVLGNDGSMTSNTDNRHSYKLQGVEDSIGAYMVSSNEVMYKETAEKTIFYAKAGADYTTDLATFQNTWKKIGEFTSTGSADIWIGEINVDLETGAHMIRTIGNGSASGTGDRYYFGGDSIGLREHLSRGSLGSGANAGLSFLNGGNGLSIAWWNCAVCV
ncbi:MAG: hypothetical protein Q4D16_19555 [Eubacteriales bacterium]|nr:hypothetical protein [Eubacteriales bacterium]